MMQTGRTILQAHAERISVWYPSSYPHSGTATDPRENSPSLRVLSPRSLRTYREQEREKDPLQFSLLQSPMPR